MVADDLLFPTRYQSARLMDTLHPILLREKNCEGQLSDPTDGVSHMTKTKWQK